MNTLLILEITSVLLNITFLFLLIKEKKVCWIYGILGSLIGTYVVYSQNLYSESLLYVFYTLVGVYAWFVWHKQDGEVFIVKRIQRKHFFFILISGIVLSIGLGYSMSKTDASKPYLDALSTIFGVFATFLEIHKYYLAWFFWIILNLYSLWLYGSSGLYFYAGQMIIYSGMSAFGLMNWRKKLLPKVS
jgi:nicotinamide mononucleotide transporter